MSEQFDKPTVTEGRYPDQWFYSTEIMQAFKDLETYSNKMFSDDRLRHKAIETAIYLSFSPLHYKKQQDLEKRFEKNAPMCPEHNIKMRIIFDKSGNPWFWGCPKYPECDAKEDFTAEPTEGGETDAKPKEGVNGQVNPSNPTENREGKPTQNTPSAKKVEDFTTADKYDPAKNDKKPDPVKDGEDYDALRMIYTNFPKVHKNTNGTFWFECPKCGKPLKDNRARKRPGSTIPDFSCNDLNCKRKKNDRYSTGIWLKIPEDQVDDGGE